LRRERRQLFEEQQRLSLEKEKVSAPARLAPAARKLGLKPATSRQIATLETKNEFETTETRDRDKPSAALTR